MHGRLVPSIHTGRVYQHSFDHPLQCSSRTQITSLTSRFTPAAVMWFSRIPLVDASNYKSSSTFATRARRGEYDSEAYEEVGSDDPTGAGTDKRSITTSSNASHKAATPSPHVPLQHPQLRLHEATIRYAATRGCRATNLNTPDKH